MWEKFFAAARDALLVTYFISHVGFTAYALCVFRQGFALSPRVEPYVPPETPLLEPAEVSAAPSAPCSEPSAFDDASFYSSAVFRR